MNDSAVDSTPPSFLERDAGVRVAYRKLEGVSPTVVFLCGFSSDMTGTKAEHLAALCRARGQAYLRLDYQGHGSSSGRFEDGTIGIWAEDARACIEAATDGPLVLVGSSMGGWVMLLVGLALRERLAGLVGIASAPDFTADLLLQRFTEGQRATYERDGVVRVPSDYDEEDTVITRRLVEDGNGRLLLRGTIPLGCPVRLIHGLADEDVPWETSLRLAEALASTQVRIELLKDGGHRLSEPHELALLARTVEGLLDELAPGA